MEQLGKSPVNSLGNLKTGAVMRYSLKFSEKASATFTLIVWIIKKNFKVVRFSENFVRKITCGNYLEIHLRKNQNYLRKISIESSEERLWNFGRIVAKLLEKKLGKAFGGILSRNLVKGHVRDLYGAIVAHLKNFKSNFWKRLRDFMKNFWGSIENFCVNSRERLLTINRR